MLKTSPSNLSRSINTGALSNDLAEQVEILLERGWQAMRDPSRERVRARREPLQRVLLLLRELSEMLPDIERALDPDQWDADMESRR